MTIKKEEYVRSLVNVKIVLGNGFDLHCNLHTKYSDYYCKNFKKYLFIQKLYKDFSDEKNIVFDFDDIKFEQLNVWDIFFALNSSQDPRECKKRWCDIEKLMLSSFQNNQEKTDIEKAVLLIGSSIHWPTIKNHIINNYSPTNHMDMFVVKYVKEKMERLNLYPRSFYSFLLSELKFFEKGFGDFIYWQLHCKYLETINVSREFINAGYIERAVDTIGQLCNNIHNLVEIDSFNYSYVHNKDINEKTQYINGSYKQPIFGVDSVFEPDDERYIFTKTARRIDLDMFEDNYDKKNDFDNVIVYGHSLDKADYSYFFPLFDKLQLTNSMSKKVVVFAYSLYDVENELSIKNELRYGISKMFYEYAKSKNLTDPKRFLDSLSTQHRVITYEVPMLDKDGYTRSANDDSWEETYKDIDLFFDQKEDNL